MAGLIVKKVPIEKLKSGQGKLIGSNFYILQLDEMLEKAAIKTCKTYKILVKYHYKFIEGD